MAQLNAALDAFPVEFELLQMMHHSFTPNTETGEAEGGWPACLFRALKVPAAAMMVVAENYQVDTGIEGSNGKGVLWSMLVNSLGKYVCTVDEALLTKDPPKPGTANPSILKIRGCRILGTPETSGLAIKPNWIKMFADSSTIWSARGLYAGIDFDFEIPCIFSVSTNDAFNLAKIDGGTRRRGIGTQWDVHFTSNPHAPHERLAHAMGPLVKRPEFYTTERKTGYLYWLLKVMKTFFAARRTGLAEKYMPTCIRDATWKVF